MIHQNNLNFEKFKVINHLIFESDKPRTIFEIAISDYESKNISRNMIHNDYLYILYKLEKANKSLISMRNHCVRNRLLRKRKTDTKMYAQWEIIDEYENFLSSIVAIHDYLCSNKIRYNNKESETLLGFRNNCNDERKTFLSNFFTISDIKLCKATRNYFVHKGYMHPESFKEAPLLSKIVQLKRDSYKTIESEKYSILKFSDKMYKSTVQFVINLIKLEIENNRYNKK